MIARTPALAHLMEVSSIKQGVTRAPLAISFSHGAIMVATLLLARRMPLAGAVLLRPEEGLP